jgi:hypothetical protein
MKDDLVLCHAIMRSDLARPAGSVTIPTAGVYGGLGVNQNALNHYVFAHWTRGDYQVDTTDAAVLARFASFAPPGTFVNGPTRVHAWPATCPRVEIAETSLANGGPSLVAFFDDFRVCFQGLPPLGGSDIPGAGSRLELGFNAKVTARVTVDFPFRPEVLFDLTAIEAVDDRTWKFVDSNRPMAAQTFDPHAWVRIVPEIIRRALFRFDATRLRVAAGGAVRNWGRPIPFGPQQVFIEPQTFYMEQLTRRRALYMVPALDAPWLEFFDGSGAPLVAAVLNTSAVPVTTVTLAGLTPAQGATLRATFTAGTPPAFVIPP